MKRFVFALALMPVFATPTPAQADTGRTVTVINTDYTLVGVQRTKTIGDPAAGGAVADSMFLILTFRVQSEAKGPRRLMLTESKLQDGSGRFYTPSVQALPAQLRTSPHTLTAFTAGYDVAPHAKETISVVFDVPETINDFTVIIPNPNNDFDGGKITFSS